MIDGILCKGIGGFYYVDTEQGVYECKARGIFRKQGITPLVGDAVQISVVDEAAKKGRLDVIGPRRNELLRPRVANVDQVVLVFSMRTPAFLPERLDRFLVLAEEQGLDIVICLTKLDEDIEGQFSEAADIYRSAGYPVLGTSVPKHIGIDALREVLAHRITVFAGPSGVGKSSLINAAFSHLSLETGEISQKLQRGKHTTRHAELIGLGEGTYIVDTPGFTSLQLSHVLPEDLGGYFPEFRPFSGQCRYTLCSHIHEPDCAVLAQVGQAIKQVRYDRYVTLYQELQEERRN